MFHRILHHQPVPASRRELVAPDLALLLRNPIPEGGVELHLHPNGNLDWLLSAPSTQALAVFAGVVERTFPGAGVNPELVPCALPGYPADHWTFAWAKQRLRHWTPLDTAGNHDYSDSLVTALSGSLARGHEVVVQFLFRATGGWEEGLHLLSSPREKLLLYHQGLDVSMTGSYTKRVPTQWDQEQYRKLTARLQEPAYHLEIRAAAHGPEAKTVLAHCLGESYLRQFNGGRWRSLAFVKDKHRVGFDQSFRSHNLTTFVNDRERRNVSRSELASTIAPTWARPHAGLQYYVEHPEITATREVRAQATSPRVSFSEVRERYEALTGRKSTSKPRSLVPSTPASLAPLPKFLPTSGPEAERRWIEMGKNFQGESFFLTDNPPWHHAAVLGATGTGKSTLLLQWALEILHKKETWNVALIDPHGTLAESLKSLLPPEIAADTIELDPSTLAFTEDGVEKVALPLNILALPGSQDMDAAALTSARDIIVDNLVYFVKNIWGADIFGPQMDHNLSTLATGLLEVPGANLVDMYYILTNPQARERFVRLVKSEGVRRFVEDELPRLSNVRYSQDRVSSTLNRLGKITNNQLLRLTLCQRVNPVDFRTLLDHRLVIINLSKTRIGNETSRFLGAMCFARLWLAIVQRGPTNRHTCLFVDEFQNFVTPSIAHVLTEARKFGLHLVMANQYLEQVPEEIRSAVVANTDTWAFFRIGTEDARRAADIARPGRRGWTEETMRALSPYRALFVQGNRLEMLRPYPPAEPTGDVGEINALVTASTRRYAAEETSEASPFLVDNDTLGPVTYAVSEGTTLRADIAKELGMNAGVVFAALRRGVELGYIMWDSKTRQNRVTDLGRTYVDAWGARRVTESEGELHMDLLARAVEFIRTKWGVEAHITPQGAIPRPLPDGTFEKDGIPCNLEVECSTLETKKGQVAKNLQKARGAGRRCLFVVGSPSESVKLVEVLKSLCPGASVGTDFAILCWMDCRPAILPPGVSVDGFPFLPTKEGETSPTPEAVEQEPLSREGSGLDTVRTAVRTLVSRGKTRATSEEILEVVPKDERGSFLNPKTGRLTSKLGLVLSRMEVPFEKEWDKERNNAVRIYRLDEAPFEIDKPDQVDPAAPSESTEESA